ncbi:MAG: hypothetical protein JNL40_12500 [Cyclobacteriaceae bacterium]|nr:hypothetical protein [Cyclobacteriaceae bacterium]
MMTVAMCGGSVTTVWAQSGYVWLIDEDSVRRGEVREFFNDGKGRGVEIKRWNKLQEKYYFNRVREFATKRDTFRVFNELQLAHGKAYWMEVALARPVCRGKTNLYALRPTTYVMSTIWGNASEILILEDPETGEVRPLTDNITEVLLDFIPPEEIEGFLSKHGKAEYRDLRSLICTFNANRR